MTAQPVTLTAIRHEEEPGLCELSALALIWGLSRAITETPPDALDIFLDELPGKTLPGERA
ncbi:MAG: hypothetical protein F4X20_06610 [Dehalococcoidia bacterium]|nr:hypothetical protein [Dehalococcoidia bacterium]